MKYKIVSDSSSDLLSIEKVPFASVPLHILIGAHEFVDDESIDLRLLGEVMASHKGRSGTACPAVGDWLEAFGEAENLFCVTITSALSGSYNSALSAKKCYEELHPERRVHIIDSLSTGPEMALIIEKLQELILSGAEPEEVQGSIDAYTERTRLLFSLETLNNLANNGRVSPAMAKLAGILGIRVLGQASTKGELEMVNKCRGPQSVITSVIKRLRQMGYQGGKIRITHNDNEKTATALMAQIQSAFGTSDIRVYPTRGLCSYYAEKGGMLIGIEC